MRIAGLPPSPPAAGAGRGGNKRRLGAEAEENEQPPLELGDDGPARPAAAPAAPTPGAAAPADDRPQPPLRKKILLQKRPEKAPPAAAGRVSAKLVDGGAVNEFAASPAPAAASGAVPPPAAFSAAVPAARPATSYSAPRSAAAGPFAPRPAAAIPAAGAAAAAAGAAAAASAAPWTLSPHTRRRRRQRAAFAFLPPPPSSAAPPPGSCLKLIAGDGSERRLPPAPPRASESGSPPEGGVAEDAAAESAEAWAERILKRAAAASASRSVPCLRLPAEKQRLWVAKYAARRYLDLLSPEAFNRKALKWLQDALRNLQAEDAVKNAPKSAAAAASGGAAEPAFASAAAEPLVFLIAGPPGAGKTTIVRILAKITAMRLFELNGSDDRSRAKIEEAVENACRRRNNHFGATFKNGTLLFVDEADGCDARALEYLARCADMREASRSWLRKPIICCCNELYTPRLRELRKKAKVLFLDSVDKQKLVARLEHISKLEKVEVQRPFLARLVERSNGDIRASLTALQMFGAQGRALAAPEFDSWWAAFGKDRDLSSDAREALQAHVFVRPERERGASPQQLEAAFEGVDALEPVVEVAEAVFAGVTVSDPHSRRYARWRECVAELDAAAQRQVAGVATCAAVLQCLFRKVFPTGKIPLEKFPPPPATIGYGARMVESRRAHAFSAFAAAGGPAFFSCRALPQVAAELVGPLRALMDVEALFGAGAAPAGAAPAGAAPGGAAAPIAAARAKRGFGAGWRAYHSLPERLPAGCPLGLRPQLGAELPVFHHALEVAVCCGLQLRQPPLPLAAGGASGGAGGGAGGHFFAAPSRAGSAAPTLGYDPPIDWLLNGCLLNFYPKPDSVRRPHGAGGWTPGVGGGAAAPPQSPVVVYFTLQQRRAAGQLLKAEIDRLWREGFDAAAAAAAAGAADAAAAAGAAAAASAAPPWRLFPTLAALKPTLDALARSAAVDIPQLDRFLRLDKPFVFAYHPGDAKAVRRALRQSDFFARGER